MIAERLAWLHAQIDDDAATFAALDSTALNGIESTAGDAREYIERIPAEVEAKRLRLRLIETMLENPPTPDDGPWAAEAYKGDALVAYGLLRSEALPYAARPGYQEMWGKP